MNITLKLRWYAKTLLDLHLYIHEGGTYIQWCGAVSRYDAEQVALKL